MKKLLKYSLLLLVLAAIYVVYTNYPRLNIISGYSAKNMSSSVFLAERTLEITDKQDNNFSPINIADDKVNIEEKSATASVYGFMKRKAIYKEGLGSILVLDDFKEDTKFLVPNRTKSTSNLPYPYGDGAQKDTVFSNVNYSELDTAVSNSFDVNDEYIKKTRAVVVIYKDKIIAEKYAEGFDKSSKILGWSMTKSITSAVLGILEKQGKIDVNQTNLFPEWENDERSKISLNNLLQMNSGLEWNEDYNTMSDVTKMLFLAKDMTRTQMKKPLAGEPNNSWNYSSGTSNLVSGYIRNQFKTHQEYLDFWYAELIDKIGMNSMLIETDLTGNYVGSSYGWATPRDWAKFGLLYLHKGNWNGEQILNESWVNYTATPTNGSNGEYGAHFWLNAGGVYPNAPKDVFSCNGYQGQRVFIIPSKNMVIVRMGLSEDSSFNFDAFLKDILASIK
ncbi:MAG: serine hydrolase [Lutibacter sp.]|uniref:serine hydrolase domain-containing protein n=1 Tax=Lutibacter sp. TaxID=1925666 RepID=UPI0019F063AB|nr:serine hydrolase [Lutibacter sp.]NOR27116.1 serine hydrolase [Lutibacter sp.]